MPFNQTLNNQLQIQLPNLIPFNQLPFSDTNYQLFHYQLHNQLSNQLPITD